MYVEDYRVLKRAEVAIDKVVLYGPNGAGKTTLMEAIGYLLAEEPPTEQLKLKFTGKSFRIGVKDVVEVAWRDGSYVLAVWEGGQLRERQRSGNPYDYGFREALREAFREGGVPVGRAAWVAPDAVITTHEQYKQYNYASSSGDIRLPMLELDVIEEIEDIASELLGIYRIAPVTGRGYETYVKRSGVGWIPFQHLAYGTRKALAMLFAERLADILFIETFEAGFHADLVVTLLKHLSEFNGPVFIETHLGLVVAHALSRGWKAYYVEKGSTKKELKSIEDLRDAELFRKEIEAMSPT